MRYVISIASLLFVCSVIFTLNDKVEACSCQPIHPQAMFCRSQYVIKAHIQRSRLVDLRPNGKYKTVKDDTEIVDAPEIDEDEIVQERNVTSNSTGDDDDNESNTGLDFNGFADEMPERNGDVHDDDEDDDDGGYEEMGGEDGQKDYGPPAEYGENYTDRLPRSIRGWRRRRNYYRGYSPGSHHPVVTPNSRTMVQYRVRIVQIYKGLENATEQQKKFIYVPPAPVCNVELKTGGNPYILMGDIHDGVMRLNLCDFKLDVSEMARDDRRNIAHNLKERYRKSCETCQVKVCYGYNCNEDEEESSSCEWKEWWTAQSPGACQYSCLPTRKGPCKWYNPLERVEKRRRSL